MRIIGYELGVAENVILVNKTAQVRSPLKMFCNIFLMKSIGSLKNIFFLWKQKLQNVIIFLF